MNYAERCKQQNIKLELSWYRARDYWCKKVGGTPYYFKHPITLEGYRTALHEWILLKAQISGERPNAPLWQHHRDLFLLVQRYWEQFGLPTQESKLARQVDEFLEWIQEGLNQPELPPQMPIGEFSSGKKRPEFLAEFVQGFTSLGISAQCQLPDKWRERLDRLTEKKHVKEPQTIGHWLDKYVDRVEKRGGKYIRETTADDRDFKLRHFKKHRDMQAHVTSIDGTFVEEYHAALEDAKTQPTKHGGRTVRDLSRSSKEGYWKAFCMFVRWASAQQTCELSLPAYLDSNERSFREPKGTGRTRQAKKSMLWSVEEFKAALGELPSPYDCFVLLMLNCGFRHVDLSELRHVDLQLGESRIVIQRNKLNQQETAPVVSYKLWDKTLTAIKATMSSDPEFVFTNEVGGQVENSIKVWWKRHKAKYGGKRLDYLRKTGSTMIAKIDPNLDELYLGESLKTTTRIHYSFNDGEPCQAFDDALQAVGAQFGLAEQPAKAVILTPEMIKTLQAAGFAV